MFTLDSFISSRSYGEGKFATDAGIKVSPTFGGPFVIFGTLLSARTLCESDLHKPLKRVYSKKSHSYFFILED